MKVTIAEYFTDRASESREKKAAVEARLAALTEQLPGAKTPPEIQGINYEIEKAKLEAKCAEEVAQSYEEGAKQGYDYTDWHVSAGTAVRERIYQSLAGAVVMGPAVYEYEGHYDNTDNGGDYDGYKKRQQTAYEDAALALEMLDYSLENDLPDGWRDGRPARRQGGDVFRHGAVRVGDDALSHRRGGNERGAGAFGRHDPSFADPSEDEREDPPFQISRPAHLRRRLLLVSFLVQGVIFTLRSPMELLGGSAVCLFGGIVQLPALLHLFWQMLLLSAGAWVLMTVALFFSVVTRRSALSILLPILVNAAAGTVSLVTVFLIQSFPKAGFLRYTILPYLDIEPFLHTPLDGYLGGSARSFSARWGMLRRECASLRALHRSCLQALCSPSSPFISSAVSRSRAEDGAGEGFPTGRLRPSIKLKWGQSPGVSPRHKSFSADRLFDGKPCGRFFRSLCSLCGKFCGKLCESPCGSPSEILRGNFGNLCGKAIEKFCGNPAGIR